jgi:hypothetical protein
MHPSGVDTFRIYLMLSAPPGMEFEFRTTTGLAVEGLFIPVEGVQRKLVPFVCPY